MLRAIKADECKAKTTKCVNCLFKNHKYSLKIDDGHDALSLDYPTFKRALAEQKKRFGWEE